MGTPLTIDALVQAGWQQWADDTGVLVGCWRTVADPQNTAGPGGERVALNNRVEVHFDLSVSQEARSVQLYLIGSWRAVKGVKTLEQLQTFYTLLTGLP